MHIPNIHNLNYKEHGSRQQKIACPWCTPDRKNKRDTSLSIDLDGRVFKCHHCGKSGKLDGYKRDETREYKRPVKKANWNGWSKFSKEAQEFLYSRGFSLATIEKNKLVQKTLIDKETQTPVYFIGYPYFEIGDNQPVNMKWRGVTEKRFMQEKDAKPVMYNLHMWHDAEELIISEGENDVLAWNECGRWDASTTNGGAINENDDKVDGKLEAFYNCQQYVENKRIVYLATDHDAPGRRLRDELAIRIGHSKCKIVSFPDGCKDANDVLLRHGKETLLKCLADAKEIPLSGVFYLADEKEAMLDMFRNGVEMGGTTHFGDLDSIFRWKKGQVNLWTGYMNLGKTTFFLQVALTKSIMDGWKWAIFSPENYPARDFYNDIIEMYVGRHVSNQFGNKMTEQEFIEACDFINDHMIFIYPDDAHTVDALHNIFHQLISKKGIDGVLIDPYNQLENSFPGKRTDEEISEYMRVVKRFTVQNEISYNIIAHPKNPQKDKETKDLKPPDAYDIAGGAMWGNKSDNIIVVHRPKWNTDKEDPSVEIYTEKIKRRRTGGKRGMIVLYWDFRVSRYHEGNSTYFCDPKRKYQIIYKTPPNVTQQLPFEDDPLAEFTETTVSNRKLYQHAQQSFTGDDHELPF